jgi:hypothetical protein
LTSPLPVITEQAYIDGTTQGGGAGCAAGAPPLIEINGAGAGAGAVGIDISNTAGGSHVVCLVVDQFNAYGIRLSSGGNFVWGNYIGVDPTGR